MRTLITVLTLALAAPAAAVPFAPYVDMAGYPPPPLAKWSQASGVKRITLGFVTAREASACEPTWGGYASYPASGGTPYRLADVTALRRRGGDVVVSFGGQAGTELAAVCSPDQLLAAYRSVVDAYGATRLDFDIEGAAGQDTAANERRAVALDVLRRQRPKLRVSLTLPVLPSGLDAAGSTARTGACRSPRCSASTTSRPRCSRSRTPAACTAGRATTTSAG